MPSTKPSTASSSASSSANSSVHRQGALPRLPVVYPVVAAITADSAATATIRITHALAEECGAIPTVLQVVHDDIGLGISTTGAMTSVPEATLGADYQNEHLLALESQVEDALGVLPRWRYEVEIGATLDTIVQRVQQLDAELTILGLPHRNFLERAFVRDMVQGVVEKTTSAVLAVHPSLTVRPRNILVAVDFGAASLRAAHLACQLVAPGGRVTLIYVQPEIPPYVAGNAQADALLEKGVSAAFAALISELASKKAITVTSVIEHGSSIEEVKAAAARFQPDLIALGSKHHTAADWFFGDSVSTELIGERQWSLLIVPQ